MSGRPLIALPGAVPIYRDLKPGAHGEDIGQFQRALQSLGYDTGGDTAGEFGSGTKTALTRLYAKLGFDHPVTGTDDEARLKAAEQAVDTAQRQVDLLKSQIAAASSATSGAATAPDGRPAAGPKEAVGGESLDTQLRYARKTLVSAQSDRARLVETTGPMLPVSEAVFLPAFPAQVTAFSAKVGDPVKAPLITLSTGELGVTSRMTPDRAALLKPGMPVEIEVTGSDRHTTGKVASVGEPTAADPAAEGTPGGAGGAGGGGALMAQVLITPDTVLGPDWAGRDVQLTVTAASSGADVLVVPLSAVSTGADGKASVVKVAQDPGGPPTARVDVVAGLAGGGFVQVTPVRTGELAPGDRVMVSEK